MEGSRSSKHSRGFGRAASRVAGAVAPVSPRRRGARRRRSDANTRGVYRVRYNPDPQDEYWNEPFEFLGTQRNPRRPREPSPDERRNSRRSGTPDPDDDPDPVAVAAAFPLARFDRRERMNKDIEYWGAQNIGFSPNWTVPIPTIVGIARGANYAQRATAFVRVARIGVKISAMRETTGSEVDYSVPPLPLGINRYGTMYFRFALVYDKQSDGVDPSVTYPDVYAPGPSFAVDSFRLPEVSRRYEVLHDQIYRWKDGEVTCGQVEIAAEGVAFWYQTGMCAHEEFYVECDKLVHYKTDAATAAAIASGNIFYMFCMIGGTLKELHINTRTTFSDNL